MFSQSPNTSESSEQLSLFRDEDAGVCVWRPMQYLGCKLRALGPIARLVGELVPAGGRVLDVFSGTSVVAQALADRGLVVQASDAMEFCATAARATLGVGRDGAPDIEGLVLAAAGAVRGLEAGFEDALRVEADALLAGDGDALLGQVRTVPQIWQPAGASPALSQRFAALADRPGEPAFGIAPLAATHYAGTYFGVAQALRVDALRHGIHAARDALGPWGHDAALTALVSAMSTCAWTPGKHFAQAHRVGDDKALDFHRGRVLQDRAIDIDACFSDALRALRERPHTATSGHAGLHTTMEALLEHPGAPAALVYADPPYTAQQYSRFYHVPEVLTAYRVPRLQWHRGAVTVGLYPEGRFKSRFSSKRAAPGAFGDLLSLGAAHQATLVISYSDSASGHTGNGRMIGLDGLLELCRARSRAVKVVELDHAYRQFNHGERAVAERRDPEYLVCVFDPC